MVIDDFNEILEKYWIEKEKPLKDNEFADKMRNEFTLNLLDLVDEIKDSDEEYKVKISPGAGNWNEFPYAGIINKKMPTFKEGLYIVCSFRDDSGFYLSIGQGEDNTLKKNRILVANKLENVLKSENYPVPEGFSTDEKYNVDLVISKFYKKDELDFEEFKMDLKHVISIYEFLIPHYAECLYEEEPSKSDLRPENEDIGIWRIAPGESDVADEAWDKFKNDSYIGVGFERDGDCPDFREFKNKYVINNYLNGNAFETKHSTGMLWKFVNWIKKGDIVVVNNGRSKLAGIGVVTGDFIPKCENNNKSDFGLNNIRSVDWIFTPDDLFIKKNFFARHTLVEWTDSPEKWNELVFTISRTDNNLRNKLLDYLYSYFWNDFLNTEKSQSHKEYYDSEAAYIKKTWKMIIEKDKNGENISDDIWDKIINRDIKLYNDAVNDIKATIRAKYKYSDEEMGYVARLFFNTINDLLNADNLNDKKTILDNYSKNDYSKGFGTGRFSSVIHYLDNSFYVINNKTLSTINLMSLVLGEKLELNSSIVDYISNNEKYKKFLERLAEVYDFDKFAVNDFVNFDTFCHWFSDKNLGNFAGKKPDLIPLNLILDYVKPPCENIYELSDFPKELSEESIEIFKDIYCNIENWRDELSDEGISIQEYFERQSNDVPLEDLDLFFSELTDVGLIKIMSDDPLRYDLNMESGEYLSVNLNYNLLESKLQGFSISEDIINQTCASLNAGKHIIFDGTPGTGKTELAIKFSSAAKDNKFMDGYVLTTATSDWSTFDTIGGLMPNSKGLLEFRAGKFLDAIEQNKWLIIDEINRADIDKAFGQLFTVLSGQDVELPYKVGENSIKIKTWDELDSKFDEDTSTYYIGQNWRIIGTMNVDDKDSLFDLSYAFMRRFMFIEIDLPSNEDYLDIIDQWSSNLDGNYQEMLRKIFQIVQYRKLGPAIFKDMIFYIRERDKLGAPNKNQVLGEAINSYILPQLEGLNKSKIKDIKDLFESIGLSEHVSDKFGDLALEYKVVK